MKKACLAENTYVMLFGVGNEHIHSADPCLVLDSRRRRCPNINPILIQCVVFTDGPTWPCISHYLIFAVVVRCKYCLEYSIPPSHLIQVILPMRC